VQMDPLISRMIADDPNDRPTAAEVVKILVSFKNS